MLSRLTSYLTSKGYTLQPIADCYQITSPKGNVARCNLRWKTKPVWGKVARRWEWSIPKRDWDRYLQSGIQLSFVLEKSTGTIYVSQLADLLHEAREYHGDELDKGGTVFLPVSLYKRLTTID